ncbi:MAG: hypothetical protein H7A00_09980 [Hahellaceae bacterium]|nr:hypothetical protein [Hahellaceae bacterium]
MNYWRTLTAEKEFFLGTHLTHWYDLEQVCDANGVSMSEPQRLFFENTAQLLMWECWQMFLRELLAYYQIKPKTLTPVESLSLNRVNEILGFEAKEVSMLQAEMFSPDHWFSRLLAQQNKWRTPATGRSDLENGWKSDEAASGSVQMIATSRVEKRQDGRIFWSNLKNEMAGFIKDCRETMAEF